MKKIIFVCTGNTCRSPMAEHLMKKKLKDKGISSKEIQVSSAGIMANNEKINPNSVEALKQFGIKVSPNILSKQLNKKLVNKNTIIITMTNDHKEWLRNLPNIYSLNDFEKNINIFDPIGMPLEIYVKLANVLNYVLDEVIEALVNNKI